MSNPLVSILVVSYQHSNYIASCLQGLINQQCDFDFEILIHDDASTDGTQEIIKEFQEKYPDLIKPVFQTENQWSQNPGSINLRFNYPRARGKFIAFCDGDDVWSDQHKLQKQISFLKAHPECILVCSGYDLINKDIKKTIIKENIVDPEKENNEGFYFDLEDLTHSWFIRNSTLVIRNVKEKLADLQQYASVFDMHLFFYAMKTHRGYYLKESTITYHKHDGGVYSQRSSFEILIVHYVILKEMYENEKHDFIKHQYFKVLLHLISLNVSGILSFKKNKIPYAEEHNQLRLAQILKEARAITTTNEEKSRLRKSLIPLQIRKLKRVLK